MAFHKTGIAVGIPTAVELDAGSWRTIIAAEGSHMGDPTNGAVWSREAIAMLANPEQGVTVEEVGGKLQAVLTTVQ